MTALRPLFLSFGVIAALACFSSAARAQATSIVSWYIGDATNVTGLVSPTYSDFDAINATTSVFTFSGVTASSGNDNAWTNWSTGIIDPAKYLEYRIAVKKGYTVTLDSISFGYASTNGGMLLAARSSADGFSADIATQNVTSDMTAAAWSVPLTGTVITGGKTFTVRFYGVCGSSSTRLANLAYDTSGGFSFPYSAEFIGTITDVRTPALKVAKKFTARKSSYVLKGTAVNTTLIKWSLNGSKKSKTVAVKGTTWKLRLAPLRTGKNTLTLTAMNKATGQTGKPVKVTITY